MPHKTRCARRHHSSLTDVAVRDGLCPRQRHVSVCPGIPSGKRSVACLDLHLREQGAAALSEVVEDPGNFVGRVKDPEVVQR
jgi:hypothetical protein